MPRDFTELAKNVCYELGIEMDEEVLVILKTAFDNVYKLGLEDRPVVASDQK
jgi:hypothetical protein